MQVIEVVSGTVIACPVTGDKQTVTDVNGVANFDKLYVTKRNYERLKN